VSLDPATLALHDYVAGLPFAVVDANDAQAATKLILNFEAANAVDDLSITPIVCDSGMLDKNGAWTAGVRHYLLESYRRLSFVGRLEVDPRPDLRPNANGVRYQEALFPLLEPFDMKGNGMVANRYIDRQRADDTWLYLPQLRRVRRMSATQRSEDLLGQDIDPDSFGGFAANPATFEWRLVATSTTQRLQLSDAYSADAGYKRHEGKRRAGRDEGARSSASTRNLVRARSGEGLHAGKLRLSGELQR
jgi:hypothetical protein